MSTHKTLSTFLLILLTALLLGTGYQFSYAEEAPGGDDEGGEYDASKCPWPNQKLTDPNPESVHHEVGYRNHLKKNMDLYKLEDSDIEFCVTLRKNAGTASGGSEKALKPLDDDGEIGGQTPQLPSSSGGSGGGGQPSANDPVPSNSIGTGNNEAGCLNGICWDEDGQTWNDPNLTTQGENSQIVCDPIGGGCTDLSKPGAQPQVQHDCFDNDCGVPANWLPGDDASKLQDTKAADGQFADVAEPCYDNDCGAPTNWLPGDDASKLQDTKAADGQFQGPNTSKTNAALRNTQQSQSVVRRVMNGLTNALGSGLAGPGGSPGTGFLQGLMKGLTGQGQGQSGYQTPAQQAAAQQYAAQQAAAERHAAEQRALEQKRQQLAQQEQKLKQEQQKLKDEKQKAAIEKQKEALRKEKEELKKKQLDLQKNQVDDAFPNQEKPTGDRAVTVVAGPALDASGAVMIDLIRKLQNKGQDVIVLPDSADYQTLIDKVIAVVKGLPAGTPVNCVGWSKGAVGCVSLAQKLAQADRTLNNVVLLDPGQGVDGSTVPGFSNTDIANRNITLDTKGRVTLFIPSSGSTYAIYKTLGGTIQADDTRTVDTRAGHLSIGVDPSVHNEIVSVVTNGQFEDGVGSVYNVGGSGKTSVSSSSSKTTWADVARSLSAADLDSGGVASPFSLLGNISTTLGSLFGIKDGESAPPIIVVGVGDDAYQKHLEYLLDRAIWSHEDHVLHMQYQIAQELGLPVDAGVNTDIQSDLVVTALRADRTFDNEYRFRGSLSRNLKDDADRLAFSELSSYFGTDVAHELLIDLQCDGSIDDGIIFNTPYYSILPRSDGADVLLSEYLPVDWTGLHCFAFVVDVNDDIPEINENNNVSEWREFIAGFNVDTDDTDAALPPLNFEVAVYNIDHSQMVQEWTTEDITIGVSQQLAFRWDAPQYEQCIPLLSAITPDVANNLSPVERNTRSENIDLHEHTGYYEIRCSVGENARIETIHVTLE